MKCAICDKEMSKAEMEAEPIDVCIKCFWDEVKKQENKKYVHKFDLMASSVGVKK